MEKKANSFNPKGLEAHMEGHRYYSATDIDAIISACPDGLPKGDFDIQQADPEGSRLIPRIVDSRTALEKKLDSAATLFVMNRSWDGKPPSSEMEKRFRRTERNRKPAISIQVVGGFLSFEFCVSNTGRVRRSQWVTAESVAARRASW